MFSFTSSVARYLLRLPGIPSSLIFLHEPKVLIIHSLLEIPNPEFDTSQISGFFFATKSDIEGLY